MYFPVSKAEGRQTVVIVEKVLFLFVEFEIIGSSAGWMRAENTLIQTAGYAFRRAAGEILISVPQNKVKQKNPGYRLKTGFSMETHVPLGQLH